ncbi:MAG: hypothetical protein JJE23_02915 [Thermoleophilia bacterium]|nr:hypothetical protein [Thermoleophilia bacterium]
MNIETVAQRPAEANLREAGGPELRKLRAENARLATEVRHARAIADGVQLGLRTMQRRLADAEAENDELRRQRPRHDASFEATHPSQSRG